MILINTHELVWAATANLFVYSYTASNNAGRLAERVLPFLSLNIDKLSPINLNNRSELPKMNSIKLKNKESLFSSIAYKSSTTCEFSTEESPED